MEPPDEFPFPFSPYSIQKQFMKELYNSLEKRKFGIFESPTGTGKSLSLICGALRWLCDHEKKEHESLDAEISKLSEELSLLDENGMEDNWLGIQAKGGDLRRKLNSAKRKKEILENRDKKIQSLKELSMKNKSRPKKVTSDSKHFSEESCNQSTEGENDGLMNDDEVLLEEITQEDTNISDEEETDLDNKENEIPFTQIIISSRTHSQLAQFVGEVKRSPYGENIRLISLASRSAYCINEKVKKLGNQSLINERCLELIRNKSTKINSNAAKKKCGGENSCPFRRQDTIEHLRDMTMFSVLDVEDLVTAGQKEKACPYYAARAAATMAQVILVPYNTLLHKETREASGIQLKDKVVIIDEAHNLLETISHIHSCEVMGHQLSFAHSQLSQYHQRFLKRFNAVNLLRLEQLMFVIGKLIHMLGGKPGKCPKTETELNDEQSKMYTLSDFMLSAEIDNINPYILMEFCNKSKLAQKIQRFGELYETSVYIQKEKTSGMKALLNEMTKSKNSGSGVQSVKPEIEMQSRNPLLAVLSLLKGLTSKCSDGRLLVVRKKTMGKSFIKFMLLNPASHFEAIVQQARSVIVAGGTMQPISEFRDRLFMAAGASNDQVVHFSCGHVIPADGILPIALTNGPSGIVLDFSYQHRIESSMMNELARILINVCNVIPAGIVCFFPSYDYENAFLEHITKSGDLSKMSIKKKVFREPKTSIMVEQVLSDYATCIRKSQAVSSNLNGALLFSVVGGKLSEGLNFSDDLGRCVIVVGLPYPNIKSPEMQEKISYLNITVNKSAGKQFYENLCMKAVNQSIGRSVRHKDDYAAVLLLDNRYSRQDIQNALPSWVQKSLKTIDRFGPTMSHLCKFFSSKKKKS